MSPQRRCTCGHLPGQHELRTGGRLGCYITGCNCIDFTPAAACKCSPCATPAYGAPGFAHCAACCGGSLIEEYDLDCPRVEHRALALRQHGVEAQP